jgi:hypothetical protein
MSTGKRGILILAICISVGAAASHAYIVHSSRGNWPADWPVELDPFRQRATTDWYGLFLGNATAYTIPFHDRTEFERLWPVILRLRTPGAPLVVKSGGVRLTDPAASHVGLNAGVRITYPSACTLPLKDPHYGDPRWDKGAASTCVTLFVDGEVIDLNRIQLPAEIRDERWPTTRPAGATKPSEQTGRAITRPG